MNNTTDIKILYVLRSIIPYVVLDSSFTQCKIAFECSGISSVMPSALPTSSLGCQWSCWSVIQNQWVLTLWRSDVCTISPSVVYVRAHDVTACLQKDQICCAYRKERKNNLWRHMHLKTFKYTCLLFMIRASMNQILSHSLSAFQKAGSLRCCLAVVVCTVTDFFQKYI